MKLRHNYHTHTSRCKHATGSDRDYIEAAIAAGIRTLGISDHVPLPYHNGYVSNLRMAVEDIGEYFESFSALREEYRGRIELLIGFEVEYFPKMFDEMLSILDDYPCDYLLLGQHEIEDEQGEAYIGKPFSDKKTLERHTDMTIEALETGEFLYLAHPDIANFVGDEKFYLQQARRICRAAKEAELPLEVNILGMRDLRWYPRGLFYEAAAEEGNTLIFGVDAHAPEQLTDEKALEAERDCIEFAESFELEILDKIL